MEKMVDPDEALEMVLAAAKPMAPARVPIEDAAGLVLAEEIAADRPYPPFDRVMMDGYAVRLADAGKKVQVGGEVRAGGAGTVEVAPGRAVRVMTGAPCPPGTETVVPVEEVEESGAEVMLPGGLEPGRHIAPMGRECGQGEVVAPKGWEVTPLVVANLAAYGYTGIGVIPPPMCALVTTGDEIVRWGSAPAAHQIRNANAPMLAVQLRAAGVRKILRGHAGDSMGQLRAMMAYTGQADVVVISGGVSMGAYDMVPDALRGHGVEVHFHKVSQKPGKPLLFGSKGGRLYFGLPGNPLACHVCLHRYVVPAVRKMMGRPERACAVRGRLAAPLAKNGARTLFQLCSTEWDGRQWTVTPLAGRGSADIHAAARANSCVRLKPGAPSLACGVEVEAQMTMPAF